MCSTFGSNIIRYEYIYDEFRLDFYDNQTKLKKIIVWKIIQELEKDLKKMTL